MITGSLNLSGINDLRNILLRQTILEWTAVMRHEAGSLQDFELKRRRVGLVGTPGLMSMNDHSVRFCVMDVLAKLCAIPAIRQDLNTVEAEFCGLFDREHGRHRQSR